MAVRGSVVTQIVQAEHVFKSYNANPKLEMKHLLQWTGQRFSGRQRLSGASRYTYVLNDVSFEMEQCDSLGIIGNNGAGKTTLCRLLASISLPTKGRIRVEGRVSSLIALGAGFHPELSGLENVYLNCSIMGLSRKQTASRVEQIVQFAELGEHIDVAVKRYSSGMLARLGFSVAVHLDPEIILIDEVLAVGDYGFQVKCLAAIREFMQRGTVVFISHDLGAVERLCKRVLWLDQGQVKGYGPSPDVISQYVAAQQRVIAAPAQESNEAPVGPEQTVLREVFDESIGVHDVETCDARGAVQSEFQMCDTLVVRCSLTASKPTRDLRIVIGLVDVESQAIVTAANNQMLEHPDAFVGQTRIECRFPNILLRPRSYGVYVGISNAKALMPLYTWRDTHARFFITGAKPEPRLHYSPPQSDLTFTPGVEMRYLSVNEGG